MDIGISLGWRCESAIYAVNNKIRKIRDEGYLTCPFDICVTNYIGLCKCIEDDFKYFCDTSYLVLKKEPKLKKILGENQTEDQYWIYNSYYNFAFNHESPGHGDIYLKEKWEGGINHFTSNNFEKFIERYTKRINNFRHYLSLKNTRINFVILRYNSVPYELSNIIQQKYPNLNYTIFSAVNFSSDALALTLKKNEIGIKEFDIKYLKYMDINEEEYPEEYDRYKNHLDKDKYDNITDKHIQILYTD
jgi:hypothetical protein